MKKLFTVMALVAAMPLFAADNDPVKPRNDAKDPTGKYADYGGAMASEKGYSMAVEWHNAVGAKLNAAVSDEMLAAFVADDAAAAKLLAQVKTAYDTDPTVATQAAAVSQWVMVDDDVAWYDFWSGTPRADGRKVWVKALVSRAENADDTYVKLFCLDQLRWCGCKCPCLAQRIQAISEKSKDKAVRDMADIVLRTLK